MYKDRGLQFNDLADSVEIFEKDKCAIDIMFIFQVLQISRAANAMLYILRIRNDFISSA